MANEEDILQVCDFTGLDPARDRHLVIAALQRKNNSYEAVVNEFFEDETKFRKQYTWDESAWTQDRDGNNSAGILFNVHPADDTQVLHGVSPNEHFTAPSRPPSRANNRSPLGKMVDWTVDSAAGVPSTKAEEDEDLQRAIAESVAVSGGASPSQEVGVTQADTNLPFFGPATRPDYDQNQWAMIPVVKDATEPTPSARKREPGVPAFLKCRNSGWERNRLGQLLTVLHEIPAARNALLRSGTTPASYGHNSEWWKGQPILSPPVRSEEGQQQAETEPNFYEETHRLIAFLDATDRSYGTADSLSSLSCLRTTWDTPVETMFLRKLNLEAHVDVEMPLWNRVDILSLKKDPEVESQDEYGILELNVPREQPEMATNLYDLWDLVFWIDTAASDADDEPLKMAYLTDAADVQIMRINGVAQPIDIPRVFYIDRYLKENEQKARSIQNTKRMGYLALAKAKELERRITKWIDPEDGTERDHINMIKRVIARDEDRIRQVKGKALWRQHEEAGDASSPYLATLSNIANVQLNEDEEKVVKHYKTHIKTYKQRLAVIGEKLAKLEREKRAVLALLKKSHSELTAPSPNPERNPKHKYTLRGVATSPDIVYLCRSVEPDLLQLEDDSQTAEAAEQWWKLAYIAEDQDPVKAEKTTFEKVVEAACTEGDKKPYLIYATDGAMQAEALPLSSALQTFVKFDNRLFKQELIEEVIEDNSRDRKRGANKILPQSPFKKQHRDRADSMDSMNTNRASLGDVSDYERDAPFESDPFHAGDGAILGTEMDSLVNVAGPAEIALATEQEHAAPPPYAEATNGAEVESPTMGRESVRLANVSLDGEHGRPAETRAQEVVMDETLAKGPEMQERGGSPFVVRSGNGPAPDKTTSIMDMDMEIPPEDHHTD